MGLDRRKFLKSSIAGSAAIAIGGCNSFASAESKENSSSTKAKLNISFQEGTAPGASLKEKFDFMEEHGVVGFEPHGKPLLQEKMNISKPLRVEILR